MNISQDSSGGVTVFRLAGRLDSTTSQALQEAILPGIAAGASRLAIDLAGVQYVSSAGLRVVLLAVRQARAAGGEMALFGLGNPVREVFEISGFAQVVLLAQSEDEALRAVAA